MKSSFAFGALSYQYEPLQSPRHIRLLRLRAQLANWRLRSHELINVHLDHVPTFCTISYQWDSEKVPGYVSIGNEALRVTLSCQAAMIYFSKVMPGRVIWINAACINQTDAEEKNAQVTLMRNIYQSTYSTTVWLGEALPDHEFALSLHAALRSDVFDINNMEFAKCEDTNHPLHPSRETDDEVEKPYHDDWRKVPDTLELVLQRSWFGRVWMIQEVALGQRIVVCCVNVVFEWDQLVEATRKLAAAQGPNPKALSDLPLKIMEARDHYQRHTFSFYQILQLSRSFDASDPMAIYSWERPKFKSTVTSYTY